MDAVTFIKERNRMCAYYPDECAGCPAKREDVMCYGDPLDYQTVNIVGIVEQWSKEHPQKTMLQDVLEKFPNIARKVNGLPASCPDLFGFESITCPKTDKGFADCKKCWNRLVEG